MNSAALKIDNVHKSFDGVKALSGVNLEFRRGEVTGLVGANGAGKSTLLNIIWGAFPADEGVISIEGRSLEKITPVIAQRCGMSIIFQHRRLMPQMSVAQNIYIDRMPKKYGLINYNKMNSDARVLLDLLELEIDSKELVANLTTEEKQLVEIAKAYSRAPSVLLMDEPTAALRQTGVDRMFDIMRTLKKQGCSVVFISHRLKEVMEICDSISILRDGQCVSSGDIAEYSPERLVEIMSGSSRASADSEEQQEALRQFAARPIDSDVIVRAKSVTVGRAVDASFDLRRGEVLGLAGLGGSGADDLLGALFGLESCVSGSFEVDGVDQLMRSPASAIRAGIGYVPEDRQLSGEFLEMSVSDNICMAEAQNHSYASRIDREEEAADTRSYIEKLAIKTSSTKVPIKNLSGGNQQKAIIAKWLRVDSKVLILNEPTSGIDVHAKKEVFKIIMAMALAGKSVLYTTSDISELTSMADRIVVVYNGKIVRVFNRSEFDNSKIHLAMNGILDQEGNRS